MKTYAYILKLESRLYEDGAWTEADHRIIDEHYQRIKRDFEVGKIIHVGRTADATGDGFGLVVFKAQDDEGAKGYAAGDPAVIAKMMSVSVKEYKVIFG
jgi:uncharacterized protein YciI